MHLKVIRHFWFFRCARKIPKPVLETKLITKETTYTLDFRKYFVVSLWSHSIRAFSVLLKDSLRTISETWRAGKKLNMESYLPTKNIWKKWSLACGKKITSFLLGCVIQSFSCVTDISQTLPIFGITHSMISSAEFVFTPH
jgi:hypothetical protein